MTVKLNLVYSKFKSSNRCEREGPIKLLQIKQGDIVALSL